MLSNIVLNELDWWVQSQWVEIPTRHEYSCKDSKMNMKDVEMAEPTMLGAVAEQEFQYGAEAFEINYEEVASKMRDVVHINEVSVKNR